MLVGIAGRKCSGKSTVSDLLVANGFRRQSMATPLKEFLSYIFNWDLHSLTDQTLKEERLPNVVEWGERQCRQFSELCNVPIPFFGVQHFATRREAMQYVGTDLARNTVDQDFWVNQFFQRYDGGNVVCDDIRFPNELRAFRERDAKCVFIMRPFYWNYSNHSSESSLNWTQFDYVIVNRHSLRYLHNRASAFLKHLLPERRSLIDRSELMELLKTCGGSSIAVAARLGCSRDKIAWWAQRNLVELDRRKYRVDDTAFIDPTPAAAYYAGLFSADGCIKNHTNYNYLVSFTNDDIELVRGFAEFVGTDKPFSTKKRRNGKTHYSLDLSSPQIVENMKLWNIEPRKSRINKVPDVIKANPDLMPQWVTGIIDGDGTVCEMGRKYKNLSIQVLASTDVVDYIKKWADIRCGGPYSEKGVDNLCKVVYSGKYAVQLYEKIKCQFGLSRKWIHVEPYLRKIWHH